MEHSTTEDNGPHEEVVPYSALYPWEKWTIVALTSCAVIFSPLSANVYFPAIPVIAEAFNVSVEDINVTVTVFMILQGVSPTFWGSLADSQLCGRRPVYLLCLLILCLSCVGLALTPTNAYWLLLLLRCVQAAGSASVIALGAGTIMDIAAAHERGTFMGVTSIGPMVGPCIGPIAGGLLAGNLGWRSIFWFLCIASGVVLVFEFIFLPETLRAIVGDGSIPAQPWNRAIVPLLGQGRRDMTKTRPEPSGEGHTPWDIIKSFGNADVCLILFSNAIPFSVFYVVMATMPTLFLADDTSLSESDLGVCYLANGVGSLLGAVCSGRILDWQWARAKKNPPENHEGDSEKGHQTPAEDEGINIPATRLQSTPYYYLLMTGIIIGYGWCAKAHAPLAALLVLQFFSAFAGTSIFTVNQTLLMDLFPGRGASVTASNNLVRCLLGAVMVSIIDYILDAVGAGWTFTIMAAALVVTYPLVVCEWVWGQKWMEERRLRRRGE